MDNLNSKKYISELVEPEVISFLHGKSRGNFQQNNTRPQVARNVKVLFSAQHSSYRNLCIRQTCRTLNVLRISLIDVFPEILAQQLERMNFWYVFKEYRLLFPMQTFKICLTSRYVVLSTYCSE